MRGLAFGGALALAAADAMQQELRYTVKSRRQHEEKEWTAETRAAREAEIEEIRRARREREAAAEREAQARIAAAEDRRSRRNAKRARNAKVLPSI